MIEKAGGLVGVPELQERWGVTRARVHQITALDGFPVPVGTVGRARVWLWREVDGWRSARQQAAGRKR